MAVNTELMDEIYDQFLVCKICYELYKRPKTLQCLHTFCTECLEKHQDAELERSYRYLMYSRAISCPICRKKTELPSGGVRRLPDNFLVANLGAVITRRLPESKVALCEICKPEVSPSRKQATCRCLDCSKLLCKKCVDLHRTTNVTKEHSLFDIEVEKDIECKVHKGETVRFYCEPCEMCICVVCTFQEHKGHEVSSFAEGMKKHSRSLDNLVEVCKDRIGLVKEQLDVIYRCESTIKEAEESIRDMAIDTIGEIRHKEKECVENVYEAYGEDTFDFIKEKNILQESLENLQSTCNLTDIIVKDKSLELLLLKKEIQDKLKNLLQRQVRQPPENAMKQVKFIPGNCVFGYLSVKTNTSDEIAKDGETSNSTPHEFDLSSLPYHGKGMLVDTMSQTEAVGTSENFTTMGNLLHQICNQLTQTEPAKNVTRSTSPMESQMAKITVPHVRSRSSSTDMRERQTMTPSTPTMKRKVQTDIVRTFDEGTGTVETPVSTKFTNTKVIDLCEQSTITAVQDIRSKGTDTSGLVKYDETATATTMVYHATTGTATDSVAMYHKSTDNPYPNTKDKLCGTTRICQTSRETMTKFVAKLDMGVNAKIIGEDKAIGTKTIVTMHASSGEADVRTQNQASETPWKEEYVRTNDQATMHDIIMTDRAIKTEPTNVQEQNTFTAWFNMVDKDTSTPPPALVHASTITLPPAMKSRGLNTVPPPVSHKGIPVQQDFLPKTPKVQSCISQTVISFDRDIMMQNLVPCDKNVGTDTMQNIQVIQTTASVIATATNTDTMSTSDEATTMCSFVYTSNMSTSTLPVVNTSNAFDLLQSPNSVPASVVTVTTSDQSTQISMNDDSKMANIPQLIYQQFDSQLVLHEQQNISTSGSDIISASTSSIADTASAQPIKVEVTSPDYPHAIPMVGGTSIPQTYNMETQTNTERVANTDNYTMTPEIHHCDQQTTMLHNIGVADVAVATLQMEMVDQGEDPLSVKVQHSGTNTVQRTMANTAMSTDSVPMETAETTTDHSVKTSDQQSSTDAVHRSDVSTAMNIVSRDQETHTSVQTSDVGVLKRPHSLSRGTSTKRTKLVSTESETDHITCKEQDAMTTVSHGNQDIFYEERGTATITASVKSQGVGTPFLKTSDTSTCMRPIILEDRQSSPVHFTNTVDRGCSPVQFETTVERSCSPIQMMTKEIGVDVYAKTREAHTSTRIVKTRETCSGYDKPIYVDKQNSPVRNLLSTRTKFTCTPHVVQEDRAASPIPPQTSECATNTRVFQLVDCETSTIQTPVTDSAIMATVSMATKTASTIRVISKEQGTEMKQVRFMNSATEMPHVAFVEKETSTVNIHVMHKNISTENIQTRDQSTTMALGVAAPYIDLVAPKPAVTVTRGTATQTVPTETKETSTIPSENADRASSPVRALTADKGVTASKAVMLDSKDTFQGVGKQGKGKGRSSPKPKLAMITEDSQESSVSSDEDSSTSSRDTLPDFPSFGSPRTGSPRLGSPRVGSPRFGMFSPLTEGRPQMGLGFGNMSHREKFWRSSPTLGSVKSNHGPALGASMLHQDGRQSPILFKIETATNTKGVATETRSTSTTDIQKEDKAVCTESVTMQGKMAECINKLKTVRQRLEQQPIYSTASTTNASQAQPTHNTTSSPLLSVKSKSIGSDLHEGEYSPFASPSMMRRPTMSFSSASDSPSESSDQEQQARIRADKARKHRPDISQLLRSSSLPESPEPPKPPQNSPVTPHKLQADLPKAIPKINMDSTSTQDNNDAVDHSRELPKSVREQAKERPKSARERSKERPRSARASSRERTRLHRQHSQEGNRNVIPRSDGKNVQGDADTRVKSPKSKSGAVSSPREIRKSKSRPMAKFDEIHPLMPSSPRNIRRLSEGTEAVRARLGETPKQRRERLEQQLTFEDRKALTRQYFQETRPSSPGSKLVRPKSARSATATKDLPPLSEKPPKVPTSEH